MRQLIPYALAFGILALFIGLILFSPTPPETTEKPTVAASIFPIYDIAKNIAGEQVDVVLILPPGASPHTFEPTPSLVQTLNTTDLAFLVGSGLDEWTESILPKRAKPIDLSSTVTLRESVEHEEDEADDHSDEGTDPHYWLTVPNAILIAEKIKEELVLQYPAHASEFEKNFSDYREQLIALDLHLRQTLAESSVKNLVTLHDAWYYFAEEYDLEIVGTFEPTAGREPTPQYLADLTDAIKASKTRTLFSEPQLNTAGLATFARDLRLMIAVLDPNGGIDGRDSYIHLMLYNAETIRNAK